MKRTVALLICFCSFYYSYAQRPVDVLHYSFSLELNDKNDTIYGRARITFTTNKELSSVTLDLHNILQGKGMKVMQVLWDPFSSSPLSFRHEKDKVFIETGKIAANDTAWLTIIYKGIPANGLIISKNKYGKRTFFSDNWPNRAHHWIPCVDDPADKASVEFAITAPSHYQVVSNGIQVEETTLPDQKKLTRWKEEVPLPTKVMVIGVADFAVNLAGNIGCIPVSSWVFPENKANGFYDYAQAKDILEWYINYIGPYAYQKLANVQSKTIFGGMENAGAIFYFENSVTGKRTEESLIAHEIVHQWFGNSATEKSFAHLWLSEGFATYLTHVYLESRYGTDSLNTRMQDDRNEIIDFVTQSHRPVVDSTSDLMRLLNTNSYQKGSWVLHMLRRQLGDSVFRKSIQEYYTKYAGSNAETKDLQQVFERVSGKTLSQFFNQWLHTGVNPALTIRWKYLADMKKLSVTVEQLQEGTVFQLPLEILLVLPGNKKVYRTLEINSRAQTLLLPLEEMPLYFEADPKTSLLFEGKVSEMK
ncbi:MAG: M1 family metallopeptidase [Chitinophagaceae bacterium]|nr:M1 family metallopeptidase [Chitinophagaceae bacterium]